MKSISKIYLRIGILILACSSVIATLFYSNISSPPCTATRATTLYVTPHFENLDILDISKSDQMLTILTDLEPIRDGKVIAGYTTIVFPYALFEKQADGWKLNTASFDQMLEKAAEIDYPFVLYIFSNHFLPAYRIPLAEELAKNPDNLMHYRDGTAVDERYFETQLIPFRLTTDPASPLTQYRDIAMKAIAEKVKIFNEKHPDLLVGVMLNGETHYLFNDFFSGTGNFSDAKFTDYHPDELRAFSEYLKDKTTLQAENIQELPLNQYEWGEVLVSGWLYPVKENDQIEVWVNGKLSGIADYHINRKDVFRDKVEDISGFDEPNSGYAHTLDYRSWKAGRYYIEVFYKHEGQPYLVGHRWVDVSPQSPNYRDNIFVNHAERLTLPKGVIGYVDLPKDMATLRYSLLADEWMHYRARNITRYVESMATPFIEQKFPRTKIFSYQLTPWLKGNWNAALLGIDRHFFDSDKMLPGITAYGGNLNNPHIFELASGRPYGVPEMHPQAEIDEKWLMASLNKHFCSGATFVSPYFIKLTENEQPLSEHGKMNITPTNTRWGSDRFYHALKKFLSN